MMKPKEKFWLLVMLLLGVPFPPLLIFVGLIYGAQYISDAIHDAANLEKDIHIYIPDEQVRSEVDEPALRRPILDRLARMMDRNR